MNAPTSANPAGCDVELPVAGIIPFSATDWPGKLTCTIFTQGCMWTCTYCHNPTLQPITPGEHAFTAVVDLLGQRRGLIDALVISAGGAMNGRLESKTMEEWDNYYSNDTLLVLRTTRILLPRLRETAERYGIADIVVMGSIAGTTAFEDATVYGSISAARNALGEQLRLELRGERIRARTIATGYVETPLTKRMSMNAVTEQMGQDPLRPRDIAEIVHHGINLPPEVTVHNIVVVPTKQGWA